MRRPRIKTKNFNSFYTHACGRQIFASLVRCLFVVGVLFTTLSSCEDEDTSVPSYRTDLLCVITNGDSIATHILLDDGHRYAISQRITSAYPNSSIRCLGKYMIHSDSIEATAYDLRKVSCYVPLPVDSFSVHPQDPVNITSVWKSGGYINLCLAPLIISSVSYQYDFSIDSVTTSPDDKTIMHTSFLFQRAKNSIEAYTSKFYHSIPLNSPEYPCHFDSMYVYVNTYDGMKVFPFER